MKKKLLILFTQRFPFGTGEEFLESELPIVCGYFEKVIIVPSSGIESERRKVPENALIIPIGELQKPKFRYLKYLLFFFSKYFWTELLNIVFKYKLHITKNILSMLFYYLLYGKEQAKKYKIILSQYSDDAEIYLYSYWMNVNSYAASLIKKKDRYRCRLVTRAHRGDLYFEESDNGYLPMSCFIYNLSDQIVFISKHGLEYFKQKHHIVSEKKLKVYRLGVIQLDHMPDKRINKPILVSCSYMTEVKRINLIIDALSFINDISLKWIHIGDGPGWGKIIQETKSKLSGKKNIEFEFLGRLENSEIRDLYEKEYFSAFINVSSSEGLPVSIMEAMSAGIPVIATDVGGVSEIVNESNGILLRSDSSPEVISGSIREIIINSSDTKRSNAYKTWRRYFDAKTNYAVFSEFLINL